MGMFMGIPRISDPTPYEYPLWAGRGTPSGYYWLVERAIESEFSFRLCLIVQQPFSGDARLALALSLRKWVVLAASLERLSKWLGPDQLIYMEDGGWDTCALCMLYWGETIHCLGCPIYIETGQGLCCGTPYHDYIADGLQPAGDFLEIANREVVFLQQLTIPEDRLAWPRIS